MAAAATRTRSPILYDGFMRKILALACFLPSLAAAQSDFEQAGLRFFEQADGPILPVERRVYTTRFDVVRTRRLGVELAATYPKQDGDSTLALSCILRKPDGTAISAERSMEFRFYGGKTGSAAANLLWGAADNGDWTPGRYEVECFAGDKPVAKAAFEISRNPAEVADGEIRVKALRIFPVEGNLPPIDARQYSSTLAAEHTTQIGIELEFAHAPLGRTVKVPVDCWFFWPDGQTSPPVVLSYEPQPTWAGGYSAGAMGFPAAGNWIKGVYTVSCSINGQPAAVERFEVN
jgi:hypothetical protein